MLKMFSLVLMLLMMSACQDTLPQRTIKPSQTIGEEPVDDTPTVITRPTDDIKWKDDFCICKDGKPVSYGNCSSFCNGKNTQGNEILYASFSLGTQTQLGGFGSLHGWCNSNLDTDTSNAGCVMQARDSSGNITEISGVSIAPKSNSLTLNVSGYLAENKTYILTLVEVSSGAKTNSVQMVKFSEDVQSPVLGPLKLNPITQYACIIREYSTDSNTGDIFYDNAYRMHFYFQPRTPPTPVAPGVVNLICHDFLNPLYGERDSELFPRFEETPGVFTLWDSTDPRFYDNDGNGTNDVNDMIRQKVIHYGGSIKAGTNFFNPFSWAGAPQLTEEAGNNSGLANLGLYMAPWINPSNYRSYCLTKAHYEQNNPLYKALGDVIQVDTEGLYIGVKTGENYTDVDGNTRRAPDDYILIRETDLKQVWFYRDNDGTLKAPTDDILPNVAVYFYYPLNKAAPYIQSSNQRLYRVRGANELNQGNISDNASTESGNTSQYPPHDRRIGCIPK